MTRPSTGLLVAAGQERRVPLRGRISKPIASCCIARLLVLATENPKLPIVTYIDSMGGSVSEALTVLSTMNGIHCPVVTFCYGQAIGPAAVIAAHGLKGFRIGVPTSRFSFKGITIPSKGSDSLEFESALALLADVVAQDVNKPRQQVFKWFKDGTQFTAQEAVANGLIDTVSTQPLFPKVPLQSSKV
jgi:ATP-dependent Clp protease protease subunit